VNKTHELRKELMEAQKKLAMLEVMVVKEARDKLLEEKKQAVAAAAEAATKALMERKQKERDALEATKKALEDARAAKGLSKGRPKPDAVGEPAAKKAATSTDSVAATLADGDDID